MFDEKLLTAFIFAALALASIFTSQNRTGIITTLILIHLALVLFLSQTITNFSSLKEIIVMLAIYLITIICLITNYDSKSATGNKAFKINAPKPIVFFGFLIAFVALSTTLYATKTVFENISEKHFNHLQQQNPEPIVELTAEQRKMLRLKKQLSENFLFKKSSDIILLIVAASCFALVATNRKITD